MKPWSHLPNAHHIDWVLESLKNNPELWDVALDAVDDAARDAARDAVLNATQNAVWDAILNATWGAAQRASQRAADARPHSSVRARRLPSTSFVTWQICEALLACVGSDGTCAAAQEHRRYAKAGRRA